MLNFKLFVDDGITYRELESFSFFFFFGEFFFFDRSNSTNRYLSLNSDLMLSLSYICGAFFHILGNGNNSAIIMSLNQSSKRNLQNIIHQ